ncbi:MAG: ribonuclease J [Erysipelotrichia bacterium]|nr:ribonuclease J [Erysipelotrichia bacterium]
MDNVKIFALGGLDENGKNMYCVEVNDVIFIIEAGIMIPDTTLLGVEFIIPDFTYLIENKRRIGGIFITHAHDDVMRALPYLLKQINAPVYTGKFTALQIEETLRKEKVRNTNIRVIDRTSILTIDGVEVRTFAMTHAVPDAFGVAIASPQGYIVYSGEYVFDYNVRTPEYICDLNELSEIGKKGVLCLLSESIGIEVDGHTAPRHRIADKIEPIFESHEGRFIVACYKQSLFRIQEILNIAVKYKKKIFFHDDNLRKMIKQLDDIGYFKLPKEYIVEKKDFNNDMEDVLIMVTGSGKRLYLKMSNIATHEDALVNFKQSDTIIMASNMVNGTEKEAVNMENEVYKEGGTIYSFRSRDLLSMHPSKEDLKMALYLFKPKYYFPVKGEYRHLIKNADLATLMGFTPDRIVLCDNGQVATFKKRSLISMAQELELDDTLIDGNENWDVTGVVLKDREILSKDGVMIIGVSLDFKTKKIVSGIDVQTRGLIYLKDADYIVKEVMKIMEETIEKAVAEKRYENIEVRMEARDKINRYLSKETGKRPMVLPVILEMNF